MIETALRDTPTSRGSRFFGSSLAHARPRAEFGGQRGPYLTEFETDTVACLEAITLRVPQLCKRGDGPKVEWAARGGVGLTMEAKQARKRVLLVCQLDGYANGWRPVEMEQFLRRRGHEVHVENTYYLSRASADSKSLRNKLPKLHPKLLALYGVEAASRLFTRGWGFGRRHLSYYVLRADCRLRRSILGSTLPLDDFDVIISATPHDAELLTIPTSAHSFYDCPQPWADEVWFEGRLTERQREKLRSHEINLLESVDSLSFSWESYARYAIEHYGINASNLLQLNWGCVPGTERARFSEPPRVAYIGSLTSRYINLPLLSRLTKLYPHIDVYGGPPPDPSLGLNYMGWAPPTVLQQYQFGLVTCTKDEIRREGFSAKHLDYIAYGLPVLVPAWRRHMDLLQGSVPYDEDTFVSVIESLSQEDEWRRVSDKSYGQAERLTWDKTLEPLDRWLRELPDRKAAGNGAR